MSFNHPYYETYAQRDRREYEEKVDRELSGPKRGRRVLADGTIEEYVEG